MIIFDGYMSLLAGSIVPTLIYVHSVYVLSSLKYANMPDAFVRTRIILMGLSWYVRNERASVVSL
jgi:hypothetical protein